jgi:ribosome biogenesis GTPase
MTKCDLVDPSEFISGFEGFDLKIVRTRSDEPNLAEIKALLPGHTTVLVGHSGVGKTTLINAIAPNYQRATGEVNALTGKGKHTSSSAKAIPTQGGWIVDTPGIRTFGLSGIDAQGLLRGFADLSEAAKQCPRDCSHLAAAPDCELDAMAENGTIAIQRLTSFRRLVESIGSVD